MTFEGDKSQSPAVHDDIVQSIPDSFCAIYIVSYILYKSIGLSLSEYHELCIDDDQPKCPQMPGQEASEPQSSKDFLPLQAVHDAINDILKHRRSFKKTTLEVRVSDSGGSMKS